GGAVSGGNAPDLRESPIVLNRDTLHAVVVEGAKRMNGMPRFTHFTERELDGLMHYVRKMARKAGAKVATN
ncbi:MAG: hypothetical protein RLW62_23485, partial [Gammaproteobacteria bacterium]